MEKNDLKIPRHIAIIMDGNGRWAKKNGVERIQGHFAGAENVKNIVKLMNKYCIHYLTLYAFSTENWKRSTEEVDALMELLSRFLKENLPEIKKQNVRLLVTGRIEGLPEKVREEIAQAVSETAENRENTLILALNYGGRCEIVDATRKIAGKVASGTLRIEEIDEKVFSENLYLPDVPDPDLMIRTSGELRLSNFLLWELSYAEFYVTETYWPDFDEQELIKALKSYTGRDRRFGGRK